MSINKVHAHSLTLLSESIILWLNRCLVNRNEYILMLLPAIPDEKQLSQDMLFNNIERLNNGWSNEFLSITRSGLVMVRFVALRVVYVTHSNVTNLPH